MKHLLLPLLALTLTTPAYALDPIIKNDYMIAYQAEGEFKDFKEAVSLAITERGMVINNVSHIGDMLERTGKDMGIKESKVYGEAEALEFCSATVSRAMMEADVHNIVFCPYIISVYTLLTEKDKVYIAYRRPQLVGSEKSRQSLQAVEKLLDDIVRQAAEW